MTDQSRPRENTASPAERHPIVAWVLAHVSHIIIVALLIVVALLLFDTVPDIGRDAKVYGLAFVVFLWPGSAIASYVREHRPDPEQILFVDVDALETDGAVALIPLTDWRDFGCIDGEPEQWAPLLYAGTNLDLEARTYEGTWRGTLTDRELIASLQAVYECREMLEEDAKRAFAYETNLWSIIRKATKNGVVSVVKTFESNTLPDKGEGIESAINDALEQYGLEGRLEATDLADADLNELEDQLTDGDDDLADDPGDGSGSDQPDEQIDAPPLSSDD